MSMISFQPEFRPALPVVFGAKDYREFRATLEQMDRILSTTGIEQRFLSEKIATFDPSASPAQIQRHAKRFIWRCATAFFWESQSSPTASSPDRWRIRIFSNGSPIRISWTGCALYPKVRSNVLKRSSPARRLRASFTRSTKRRLARRAQRRFFIAKRLCASKKKKRNSPQLAESSPASDPQRQNSARDR